MVVEFLADFFCQVSKLGHQLEKRGSPPSQGRGFGGRHECHDGGVLASVIDRTKLQSCGGYTSQTS